MIIPYSAHRRCLNALMDEAGRHSVPTVEEEHALIAAAKRGDRAATERLVLGNLRFVIKMAHSLGRNADLIEELAAAGVAGLMEALKAYCQQASRGARFIHYAAFHIRRQMRRTLNDYRTPVTTNPNNYDIAKKIFAYEETVLKIRGCRPSHAETGNKFGLTPNRVERMKRLMENPVYLDHSISGEEERSGHDVCADTRSLLPSKMAESRMEHELIKTVMREHLSDREIVVLERRFGFGTGEKSDLSVLGKKFNLSRERIRQIETAALKKLRFHLAQVCPLYRERAEKLDDNVAIMEESAFDRIPARLERQEEPVRVVAAQKRPAPKMPLVRAAVARMELAECAA